MNQEKHAGTQVQQDYGDHFGNTMPQTEKHGHVLRNILIVLGVLIVLAAIALITAINLALQTDNLDKFGAQASNKLVYTLAQSVVFGAEQEITDSDLNSMLAYVFQQRAIAEKQTSPINMDALAVALHKEQPSEVYARLNYMGQVVVLSANAQIKLDAANKRFTIELTDAKVGSLPVPSGWVTGFLFENESVKQLSDKLTYENSTIYLPSEITANVLSQDISFEIKKFALGENNATVLTTSAADVIGDFFNHLFD